MQRKEEYYVQVLFYLENKWVKKSMLSAIIHREQLHFELIVHITWRQTPQSGMSSVAAATNSFPYLEAISI